jgi:PIN domain nuclease of toxin-antitoxin system
MSRCVLDASAILAVLLEEPGCEAIPADALAEAIASTVNLAEVHTKLVSRGGPPEQAWADALSTVRGSIAFDEEQARLTGTLAARTQSLGLSLGDRACLALGMTLQVPVYTADKSWKRLHLGIPVHIIR